MEYKSFFEVYEKNKEFIDRKLVSNEEAVDVIIPTINTNIFFENNLYSYYKEIPINRLLIGDGGCTDNTIEIVKKFPRVKIIDQRKYNSLGRCITELMSLVITEWFIYLHSDVYLPKNWYDDMKKYQNKYDFYETDRRNVFVLEFNPVIMKNKKRAFSGSQMCRKKAFKNIILKIEDDYLYRNEDIIFSELIKAEGFKYSRIFDTFHYHEAVTGEGRKEQNQRINGITVQQDHDINNEIITTDWQATGIIKYLQPKPYLISRVNGPILKLRNYNALNVKEFKNWVEQTNNVWLKYIRFEDPFIIKIFNIFQGKINSLTNKILKFFTIY